MTPRASIEKAASLLRAAGDDAAADELLAELAEHDEVTETPAVEVNIDLPADDLDGSEELLTTGMEQVPAAAVEMIEKETEGTVAIIEAQTAAALELADAEFERERERAALAEPMIVHVDPDPEPRTSHPFYRKLGK